MKRNKGITLIALVITIIVLLILAGVAISMLSGENGILRKAAEAKTKTEEAQKEEDTSLIDMELTTHFITNNSEYKCRLGCITGIKIGEPAKDLKDGLKKSGYKLMNIENTEEIADDTTLKTGMAIVKDGKIMARTVIFGDVDCDGGLNINDINFIGQHVRYASAINYKDYKIIASDTDHNGYVDSRDEEEIGRYTTNISEVNQNFYATEVKEPIKLSDEDIINKLGICEQNDFEVLKYKSGKIYYKVNLNNQYSYKTLANKIQEFNSDYKVRIENYDSSEISTESEDTVESGKFVIITLPRIVIDGSVSVNKEIEIEIK